LAALRRPAMLYSVAMPITYLNYSLSNQYLQNWLVAGPLSVPVSLTEPVSSPEDRTLKAIHLVYDPEPGVTDAPVDLAPFQGRKDVVWHYHRCGEDHLVDFTDHQPDFTFLRAWAYAQVMLPAAQEVELSLTTYGPADVWVNGQHAGRVEHAGLQRPRSVTLPAAFQAGSNAVLVRFEAAGVGEVPYVLALRLAGAVDAQVRLPANIEPDLLPKRQELETLAYAGTLDRYVYGYLDGDRYDKNEPLELRFPADLALSGELTFRLQSPQADIFQERTPKVSAGTVVPLARTFPMRAGPHHLAITPTANDYFVKQLRFERKELFHVVRTPYTVKAGATLKARRQEALEDAAARRGGSLYTELARLALGRMDKLDAKVLRRTAARLSERQAGSVTDLLGALVALRRFAKKKPRLERDLRLALEGAAAGYNYGPGANPDVAIESRQLVYHACELLAGQLLPERTFAVTGETGAWHAARGEAAALAWLRQRGAYGFADWHSPAGVEETVAALACLIDLADSEPVRELAAVLLDKVLFGLAVNSFEGAYGAARGRTDTGSVLSARLEPTSGVQRLLWGRGNFNEHVLGTVCLALCRGYELPGVIAQAATEPVDAFWSRERHARPAAPSANGHAAAAGSGIWSVETAVYKTRDFMLASAQDYAPGTLGRAEHIWQATLGPDAIAFVSHPANLSLDDAHRPNFWAGNGLLPRVGQWGDVLIALYRLPAGDWLGYTHAYFPAAAFDEYRLDGQWAFARQGTGYLALRAENGLTFVTTGPAAYRELRSPGAEQVWLCHMGQALLDGSFEDFQRKLKDLPVTVDGLRLEAQTLRGDRLAFGWEGPLLINGEPQPLAPQRHIENPYCVVDLPAAVMDIVGQGEGVRLKFE
jgi:hypothetical protein